MKALQGKVKYIYFYVTPTFTPLVFLGKKPEEIPAGCFVRVCPEQRPEGKEFTFILQSAG